MVSNPPNWFFSACAFISFVLCAIPLRWHLEAWNTGTCMFMIWTGLGSLNLFINSVIWNSDVVNRAPVFCDISAQLTLAASIGIPASCLCINRRLYQIASVQCVTRTHAQKRRGVMIDLAICLGIPLLELALHPIVQSHRFVIYEQSGCFPFTLNTPATYAIYLSWPVVMSLVSASYSIRILRHLVIRRAQFREFLSTNRNLSSSRYFRLMGLACTDIVFTIPLAIFSMYTSLTQSSLEAYIDWDNAHADFSRILQVPAAVWQMETGYALGLQVSRYSFVLAAFVFFGFFGFADEARRNYRLAYTTVAKRVGLSTTSLSAASTWSANGTSPDSSFTAGSASLPVYITQETKKKRDSLVSFSSRMSLPDVGGALVDVKKSTYSPTATSATLSKESLPQSPVDVSLPTLPEMALDPNDPPRYPGTPRAV